MPWIYPTPQRPLATLLPAEFIEHWQNLALTTGQGDPFSCGAVWNLSYHEIFTPDRSVFYDCDQRSAIIFSMRATPYGFDLVPIDDGWMFGQPLLGLGAPLLLLKNLCGLVRETQIQIGDIYISGLRKDSDLPKIIFESFGRICNLYRFEPWQQASASLTGGIEGWLMRRSANFRAKLRKASRKACEKGIIFERIIPNIDNTSHIFSRMVAVEAQSWKGMSGCGIVHAPEKEYYARMLEYLARDKSGLVIIASCDGEDVGFIFGGLLGYVYRGQQFSYASHMTEFSIGNLLQYEKVRWLSELGIAIYDLGSASGPKMEYKKHWAERFPEMETWIIRLNERLE